MLNKEDILAKINTNYYVNCERIELTRDMGSTAYTVFSSNKKYFLRKLKPSLFDTALKAVDIQLFLQNNNFPVPPILFSKNKLPYIREQNDVFVLYDFIDGNEVNPECDAEKIGALVGELHRIMKQYNGDLVTRDKHFFIGRFIEILRKKQYPRVEEFLTYGEMLWDKIKNLPQGYCHGDMYCGNILKSTDGTLFVLDFDTSCKGFPMYDLTLIGDMTEYFHYDESNYNKSNQVLSRMLPEYMKFCSLSQEEINAFPYLIALQHFSTQATVMEIFGIDCVDNNDLDGQLDWLYRWSEQCDINS